MSLLYALILFIPLCYILRKAIKSHAGALYIVLTIAALAILVLDNHGMLVSLSIPAWMRKTVVSPLAKGVLAGAFFFMVMFVGALNRDSWYYKAFMPIRAELSIIACIFSLLHFFLSTHPLAKLLTDDIYTANWGFIISTLVGIYALVIMLPLMITSFKEVRKQIKMPAWLNLQNLAYLVYAFVYLHVAIFIASKGITFMGITGQEVTFSNAITSPMINKAMIYSVVFFGYVALRIEKALRERKTA